jgi:hypothetical protein
MKLLFRLVPALAVGLALSSCVVDSDHPLISPAVAQPDPQLVGTWHTKAKVDEIITFSIKNAHWMHVEDVKAGKPAETHDFTVAVINGERYMQFHHYDESMPEYAFLRYRMIAGRGVMTTWSMDSDKAARLVRAGALKGVVHQTSSKGSPKWTNVDVTLTAGSPALAKFLGEDGPHTLFSNEGSNLYRLR